MNEPLKAQLEKEKIIVIMRGITGDRALKAAEVLAKGGIRFLEVTFDPSEAIPPDDTASLIGRLVSEFGDVLHIGAGTVLTAAQAELAHRAGAEYIISPDTDRDVIQKTKQLGMLSMPGAVTPSEIKAAHNAGADYIKIFPAGDLGVGYIKSVKASLSHVRYLAVGGVNLENMRAFRQAGACGFGIGASLLKRDKIEAGQFQEIAELAKRYTHCAQEG